MFKLFLEQAMPTIMQAIISVLGVLFTFAIAKLTQYLVTQREAVIKRIGADQYNFYQSMAEAVYFGVEQQLKKAPGTWKKAEFDKRLLAKVPGLTQEELDHFREAVIGKVKASAVKLLEPATPVEPQLVKYTPETAAAPPPRNCEQRVIGEDAHNIVTHMTDGKFTEIAVKSRKHDYQSEYDDEI